MIFRVLVGGLNMVNQKININTNFPILPSDISKCLTVLVDSAPDVNISNRPYNSELPITLNYTDFNYDSKVNMHGCVSCLTPDQYSQTHYDSEILKMAQNQQFPHHHNFIELFFLERGSVIQFIENKEFSFHPGDVWIIPPFIQHYESLTGQHTFYCLSVSIGFIHSLNTFTPALFKDKFLARLNTETGATAGKCCIAYYSTNGNQFNSILPHLNKIAAELLNHTSISNLSALNSLAEILLYLSAIDHYTPFIHNFKTSSKDALYANILSLLYAHKGNISRQDIAEQLFHNPDYISQVTNTFSKMGFSNLRFSISLDYFEYMLLHCDLTISDILDDLDITNKNTFYKKFIAKHSITPKEFRTLYKAKR